MIPYLLLLVFVTGVAYLGRRSGHRHIRATSQWVVGAALVLFAGLRDVMVGTDTEVYVRHFYASDSFEIVLGRSEFGYYLLSWFARSLSDSYLVLLVLIALVVVACYMATIVRVVSRYETSIFLFVVGTYTFFFNGARQGIAAAICFLALRFLLERRVWPYIVLVAVAATFHRTAWIALPLYWLASPHLDWRRLIFLGVTTGVTIVFLEFFVGLAATLLSDSYAGFAEAGEGGGEVWVAYFVAQGAALFYLKRVVPDANGWYGRLLNIYMIGLVPALASTLSGFFPSGILRLHLYFTPTAILLWPMVFRSLGDTELRRIIAFCFLLVMLAFFVLTKTSSSHLVPYRLNSTLTSSYL